MNTRNYATEDSLNVGHSHFLAHAPPNARWSKGSSGTFNSEEEPSLNELEGVTEGQGKLLPTSTHLFKLILPLGNLSHPGSNRTRPKKAEFAKNLSSAAPPTVMLLHPSQPLSHVGSIIRGALSPASPIVSFRSDSTHGQAFQWSDSTDIGDFVRDAARSAHFLVVLTYEPTEALQRTILDQESEKVVPVTEEGGTKDAKGEEPLETVIEVKVPTFADRTRYLRKKLKSVEDKISGMEGLKHQCEKEAHAGARRMAITGFGMLVVYWGAVARLTFWDVGWDVMEPVTYLSGLTTVILGYLWFLYQGREVSYSSVLAQSISKRRGSLYKAHGFDIERWIDLTSERKALRKEIGRIAEDYEDSTESVLERGEVEDSLDLPATGESQKDRARAAAEAAKKAAHGGNAMGPLTENREEKEEKIGKHMANKADRED